MPFEYTGSMLHVFKSVHVALASFEMLLLLLIGCMCVKTAVAVDFTCYKRQQDSRLRQLNTMSATVTAAYAADCFLC